MSGPVNGGIQDTGKAPNGRHVGDIAFRGFVQRNIGLLLILAAQGFFALMNVAVQKLHTIDPPVSTFQLILVRMVITYVCSITYMMVAGIRHPFIGPEGVRLLLVLRGSSGFVGLFGLYYSLQYLSLSDATVLTFLAPFTTGIAGAIFLGEHFSSKQVLASVSSLVGVVLIARPSALFGVRALLNNFGAATPEERLFAVGVSLIGICGMTGAYVTIRAIGKRAHPLHAMVAFSSQCIVGSTIGMFIQRTPLVIPTQLLWLGCLIMIGVFGFVAQFLLTMGLQREKVGRGATAIYSQMVFAIILEFIFFGTLPSSLSATGAVIIISAALYVALSKKDQTPVSAKGDNPQTLEEGQNGQNASEESADETTALLRGDGNTNRPYT